MFEEAEQALQPFRLINEGTYQALRNQNSQERLLLCFLSLKNKNSAKQHLAWHWHYFLKTGEAADQVPDYIKEDEVKTD